MSAQLAVLGLLAEQPLHGYGIEKLIEQRGMRKWTSIGFSSIYHLLEQLVHDGLAEVRIEPAPGRGKQRRTHVITAEGRRRWQDEMLRALADIKGSGADVLLALSALPLLDQTAVRTALQQRLAQLESDMTDLDRDLDLVRPVPPHVEAMFDFTRTRLASERDWLRSFLTRVPMPSLEAGDDHD